MQTKAPAGGTIANNQFTPGGRFLPRALKRIRTIAEKLVRLARKKEAVTPALEKARKAFAGWLDKNPILNDAFGIPEIRAAVSGGRRMTAAEIRQIERVLKIPVELRLPAKRRSDVAERMLWLNAVHDSLNQRAKTADVIKNPNTPEHLRALFHKAAKLSAALRFHDDWNAGFPGALNPAEWYDKTMNPMHVAFHEQFAKGDNDPLWGVVDPHGEGLTHGNRPLWEHAPAQAAATAVVGMTSPGMTPRLNGLVANAIVARAVEKARENGSDQWIDYVPDNQERRFTQWLAANHITHPGSTDLGELARWAKSNAAIARNPQYKSRTLVMADNQAVATPDAKSPTKHRFLAPGGEEALAAAKHVEKIPGVPIPDAEGKLQAKEWSTKESVGTGLRTMKRLLNHIRETNPAVKAAAPGAEKTQAEMRAFGRWLVESHPLSEIEHVMNHPSLPPENDDEDAKRRKLELGFRKDENGTGPDQLVRGALAFGPKVGEFILGLSGVKDVHVQDMWEKRRIEATQGTVSKTPAGGYDDEKTVGYNDLMRRVAWTAAKHTIDYLKQHHPDHPILKHPNNTTAIQALEWMGVKTLIDKDGLLDFLSESPHVGAPDSDYVSAANDVLAQKYNGRRVFSPRGKRLANTPLKANRKTGGLASRPGPLDDLGSDPESPVAYTFDQDRPEKKPRPLSPPPKPAKPVKPKKGEAIPPTKVRPTGLTVREEQAKNPERLARGPESPQPEHVVYVSPNTREGGTVADAYRGVNGPDMQRLAQLARLLPTVRRVTPAIGFWSDGAEESSVVHAGDPAVLQHIAQSLGQAFNQKAALWFREEPSGPDARHVIVVRDTDPEKIASDMQKHGIEYKTLIPQGDKTRVEAVDMGDGMRPQYEGYASAAGALAHEIRPGTAGMYERQTA